MNGINKHNESNESNENNENNEVECAKVSVQNACVSPIFLLYN